MPSFEIAVLEYMQRMSMALETIAEGQTPDESLFKLPTLQPLQSTVREGYTDSNLGELRRAIQWLIDVSGVWRGDGKNRPQLPRWASAPSGPCRHPGEDATYQELEARLGMFASIGLQLYRALKHNASGTDSRQMRRVALRAWEQKFKDK